jgi:hypothetical protein
MKKYLIPVLATAFIGMAPGAFAHDSGVRIGTHSHVNVGVFGGGHQHRPSSRPVPVRAYGRHDFRHDHRQGRHFDRHDQRRHRGWHKHRNGRAYRNCHYH